MEYSLRMENIVLTVPDRKLLNEKLERLEKFVKTPYIADVSLVHTSHPGSEVKCIMNIEQGKRVYHAERESNSIQTAIDEVIAALSSEMRRWQEKQRTRERVRV